MFVEFDLNLDASPDVIEAELECKVAPSNPDFGVVGDKNEFPSTAVEGGVDMSAPNLCDDVACCCSELDDDSRLEVSREMVGVWCEPAILALFRLVNIK